jgi:hypothetical protein
VRGVDRPGHTLTGGFAWTGDGKALLFAGGSEEPLRRRQVWAIPLDGDKPYVTGVEFTDLYSLSVHPTGHVAFTGSVMEADEISVLESLFPRKSSN